MVSKFSVTGNFLLSAQDQDLHERLKVQTRIIKIQRRSPSKNITLQALSHVGTYNLYRAPVERPGSALMTELRDASGHALKNKNVKVRVRLEPGPVRCSNIRLHNCQ